MFAKETYEKRRNSLRKKIKSGIILLLGNSEASRNYPSNYEHFRQDSTFLYYFGINAADLVGVIDVDNATDCLYGNDYTLDDIIWMGDQPTVKQLAAKAGVNSTHTLRDLQKTVKMAISKGRRIHFLPPYRAENTLKLKDLLGIKASTIKDYVSKELISAVVSDREIKSKKEIEELDRAFAIGYEMHTLAMQMCKPKVKEREIAGAIEGIALCKGLGVSFHNIVSHNGQTLHNHCHDNKLDGDRLLLVDAGAETVLNYCSDNTRTMPVSGIYTNKQRDVYTVLTAAFEKSLSLVKAGITYQSVQYECFKVMAEGLSALGLIKGNVEDAVDKGVVSLFMPHGLGHQLGLDVHDMENFGENFVGYDEETERSTQFGFSALRMGKRLRPGHVITVEPGIYFVPKLIEKWRSEGINRSFLNYDLIEDYMDFGGMRVEDTVVVTEGGSRILGNKRIPYTADQIEDYMAKFK
ncbi:MAG: Xaa-Pro aminopeptidase [Rikenellaceae bacterium]